MLEPDMVLIGESDSRAGDVLERLYPGVCENDPPFRRMSLVNAELTKIAVNTYVTMKISYANALADMCERLPGADVEAVTDALGLDTRIGPKYLRGGLAYGGPCFPRDNKAFGVLARDLGTEPLLAEATDAVNVAQTDRLARVVQSRLEAGNTVGILGLTYKPDTGVIEESPGIALARLLGNAGYEAGSTTRSRRRPGSTPWAAGAGLLVGRRAPRAVRRDRDCHSLARVCRASDPRRSSGREDVRSWSTAGACSPRGVTESRSCGSVGRSRRRAPDEHLGGPIRFSSSGAGGFIGGWLVRYLREDGFTNSARSTSSRSTSGIR